MARKSNKTAHVLNLIAGHDAAKDAAETIDNTESQNAVPSPETEKAADTAPAATSAAAQGISVIDTTEEDPVADLIQQKLSHEFQPQDEQQKAEETGTAPETASQSEAASKPESDPTVEDTPALETTPAAEDTPAPETIPAAEDTPAPETIPATETGIQPESVMTAASEPEAAPAAETTPQPDHTTALEYAPQQEPSATVEDAPQPELSPAPEPEPDFVRLNIMEEIVKDKIIYFMRQFDVCTCDRCVNDTIALVLNGVLPKYIVTTPAAVDPLLSYYTNRLISDVTVEATKACMIVKENPRH